MPYMEHDTSIRPLKFILKVFNSLNSYAQHSDGFLQFPNARTSIWDCFRFHVSPEFSSCFYFIFFAFSHLFPETCVWFDLFRPSFQFFTDSPSSVVIVTASYLCVVEFVKALASAAPPAALRALCVTFLWSMFLAHLLKKKMLGNVIVTIYVLCLGKPFHMVTFYAIYFWKLFWNVFFFPHRNSLSILPPKSKKTGNCI